MEENDDYDDGDKVYILFKKDNEFILYNEDGISKGTYEYNEDPDGEPYDLKLDSDDDPNWNIEFRDDHKFKGRKGSNGPHDVEGKFKWLDSGSIETNNLVLKIYL